MAGRRIDDVFPLLPFQRNSANEDLRPFDLGLRSSRMHQGFEDLAVGSTLTGAGNRSRTSEGAPGHWTPWTPYGDVPVAVAQSEWSVSSRDSRGYPVTRRSRIGAPLAAVDLEQDS